VIELEGHSGRQAPQAMHSSVIFIAMGYHSLVNFGKGIGAKVTVSVDLCQMTNVVEFDRICHLSSDQEFMISAEIQSQEKTEHPGSVAVPVRI
jgi:hypothetical protein